jgi:hypothetical protein
MLVIKVLNIWFQIENIVKENISKVLGLQLCDGKRHYDVSQSQGLAIPTYHPHNLMLTLAYLTNMPYHW